MQQRTELVFLTLALAVVSATWIGPNLAFHFDDAKSLRSTYRDPSTGITHIINHGYWFNQYMAVANNGTVLHSSELESCRESNNAVIRGTGDGKRLFVVMDCRINMERDPQNSIQLLESDDGGHTWSEAVYILPEDNYDRRLCDVLYIAESGRIYVFISTTSKYRVTMISRAPGSTVFSREREIISNFGYSSIELSAAYSIWVGKPVIHLAYKDSNNKLAYTRSDNNGVTWSRARTFDLGHMLQFIHSMEAAGPALYIAVTISTYDRISLPELLVQSADYGQSFLAPVNITIASAGTDKSTGRLALCGTSSTPVVASFFTTWHGPVNYTVSAAPVKVPQYRQYPAIPGRRIIDLGVVCTADEREVNVTTFVFTEKNHTYDLYFAKELIQLPINMHNKAATTTV